MKQAFELGKEAYSRGYERESCPYKKCKKEIYWLGGYDGLTWKKIKYIDLDIIDTRRYQRIAKIPQTSYSELYKDYI